jgi:signal transduction histidine kinase
VFLELVRNAIDAIPKTRHGLIKITGVSKGVTNQIVVEDNGVGVEFDDVKRIFELGKTTKGSSHSGKGLFDVYFILKLHQGIINVESQKGRGTKFIIELPVFEE